MSIMTDLGIINRLAREQGVRISMSIDVFIQAKDPKDVIRYLYHYIEEVRRYNIDHAEEVYDM